MGGAGWLSDQCGTQNNPLGGLALLLPAVWPQWKWSHMEYYSALKSNDTC
jgi:hypothetical protein